MVSAKGYYKPIKDHLLTRILIADRVQCFQIGHNDDWMTSTIFTFSPAGIWIGGDYAPYGYRGGITAPHYGLEWFVGQLSSTYMNEKFRIEDVFDSEQCKTELEERSRDIKVSDPNSAAAAAIDEYVDDAWHFEEESHYIETAGLCLGKYFDMTEMPYRFQDAVELDKLVALQRRFRELFWNMYPDGLPIWKEKGRGSK